MQKWYECLKYMKKKDEIKMEEMHQHKVHKLTKQTLWRRGGQILEKEDGARLLDRCEAKRKEWSKHWQCDEVQSVRDKPWREESRKCEESGAEEEGDLKKAARLYRHRQEM